MSLGKLIIDCLTGIDGVTYDPARVYLAMATLVFMGGGIMTVVHNKTIDFQAFGIGFGSLIAGGGLGIALKAKTEPPAK